MSTTVSPSLTLSSAELSQLRAAIATILSPLAHDDPDAWRAAVAHDMRALTGADHASMFLPLDGVTPFYSDQIEQRAFDDYAAYYHKCDLSIPMMARLGIEAWTSAHLCAGDMRVLFESEGYVDWFRPNDVHDGTGIVLFRYPSAPDGPVLPREQTPYPRAFLTCFHEPRGAECFGDRELALMQLLTPVFRSGVSTVARLWRRRRDLAATLDGLGEPLEVRDAAGHVVHRTPTLGAVLDGEPDRDLVAGVLEAVARRTAALTRPQPERVRSRADDFSPLDRSIATSQGRYSIRASLLPADTFDMGPTVLLTVRREQAQSNGSAASLEPDTLRARFGLSRREADVARLVARGASNAEIASALAISVHTAERHVEHLLAKLGVHSRTAAAAILVGTVDPQR